MSSGCYSVKVQGTPVCKSIVAMVTDLWCHLTYDWRGAWLSNYDVISLKIGEEHGIQCMPCPSKIISEMLPEIHTMEKCYFLKPIIHSQIM